MFRPMVSLHDSRRRAPSVIARTGRGARKGAPLSLSPENKDSSMPKATVKRKALAALRKGSAPATAAGEFVREEMHHRRAGKHGPETRAQAIAIGLSMARRAGIEVARSRRGKSKNR